MRGQIDPYNLMVAIREGVFQRSIVVAFLVGVAMLFCWLLFERLCQREVEEE